MTTVDDKHKILVVDDSPINLDLLVEHLGGDYEVLAAINGEIALETAAESLPDLILLDVMMPELSGFEVCTRLKQSERTRDIPVIFVTALDETDDTRRGFDAGAVDYISKPFNPDILEARVRTHLRLHDTQTELARQNDSLEAIVKDRTHDLEEARTRLHRLDALKQEFLQGLSHELLTPTNGILGLGEIAFDCMKKYAPDQHQEFWRLFVSSGDRMVALIQSALVLADLQMNDGTLKSEPVRVRDLLENVQKENPRAFGSNEIDKLLSGIHDETIAGHASLLTDALATLFQVAERLSTNDHRFQITISSIPADVLEITIQFECPSSILSDAAIESFFEVFSTERTASVIEDLGLKIPVASRVVGALGGKVSIERTNPDQARLRIQLRK